MRTICALYDVVRWVQPERIPPLVCGDLAVGYVVATVTIEVRALWCRLYADSFLYD